MILIGIILLSAFLRFFQLGSIAPSLTWDEVSWGYNAFSLGIDGRDEFGKFLPLTYLESFGDFKPTLYAYISVIPVKILGLNEFAVRFSSAFFGVLTVLLTYFLVKKVFKNKAIALLSAFILTISPWHIMLSRAAFEANVATFFIALGVYLFLVGLEKKWFLILSLASFVLSMYTFNTARIVSPLLVIVLLLMFRGKIWKVKQEAIIAGIVALIIFLPLALFLITPQAQLRFKEVNIFSDPSVVELSNLEVKNDNNVFWSKLLHNRRFIYISEFFHHYFDDLSPNFLFIKGDGNPKFSIQDVGEMYIWEFPFFIFGFLYLFRKKEGNYMIIPLWLVIGLIPAATARETPHALRIEAALPTFQIISAYGLYYAILLFNFKFKGYNLRKTFIYLISTLVFFNFIYFYHNLFTNYSKEYAREWQYGYKDSIAYIKEEEKNYDRIYIADDLGRPYIYTLFYLKYDPIQFRKEAKIEREALGFVHVKNFGKYNFFGKGENPRPSGKVLYLNTPQNVPSNAQKLKTFYLPDGSEVLVAYTQ